MLCSSRDKLRSWSLICRCPWLKCSIHSWCLSRIKPTASVHVLLALISCIVWRSTVLEKQQAAHRRSNSRTVWNIWKAFQPTNQALHVWTPVCFCSVSVADLVSLSSNLNTLVMSWNLCRLMAARKMCRPVDSTVPQLSWSIHSSQEQNAKVIIQFYCTNLHPLFSTFSCIFFVVHLKNYAIDIWREK